MDELIIKLKHYRNMMPVYGAMLLFSLHYYLIGFINSTNLSRFWSTEEIGALYLIGSVITCALFLFAPPLVRKIKTYPFLLAFLFLEGLGTLLMALGNSGTMLGFGFVLTQLSVSILYFLFDIYLQRLTTNKDQVGSIRSVFLTLANITVVISPTISAALINTYSFNSVYVVSLLFFVPLVYIAYKYFKLVPEDATSRIISLRSTFSSYIHEKDLRRVFEANMILKIFYGIMTIYLPLYMINVFGFSWDQIGIMITVMLLPFVLLEIPYGNIADRYLGGRGIMEKGIFIAGGSMLVLTTLENPSFWIITAILFVSRVGASAIEMMTETYFFKKVSGDATDLVSFFRITNPLSFIIAPIIGGIILFYGTFEQLFFGLGIVTLLGIIPAFLIKDTK